MSESFGTTLAIFSPSSYITHFSDHAILDGVSEIYMILAGSIAGEPPSSEEAWSEDSSAVVTTALSGKGHVVVTGDINLIENDYIVPIHK